jgi:preprotein translocase subunit YajC
MPGGRATDERTKRTDDPTKKNFADWPNLCTFVGENQKQNTTMIDFLQAAVPAEPQVSWLQQYGSFIMIGLMFVGIWLLMWRPEAKRRKQMQEFREGLKKGDKVITAGGIYGTVKEVKETSLLIEVDSDVTLRIDKNMIMADNSAAQQK